MFAAATVCSGAICVSEEATDSAERRTIVSDKVRSKNNLVRWHIDPLRLLMLEVSIESTSFEPP